MGSGGCAINPSHCTVGLQLRNKSTNSFKMIVEPHTWVYEKPILATSFDLIIL